MTLTAIREARVPEIRVQSQPDEKDVVVICPQCKAVQTLQILGARLVTTRKFHQEGQYIFHDCGSSRPCRLYQN